MPPTADVVIVGAGPAGSVAAIQLARAGARVRIVDRAAFPRPKLCGDTLNPGAMALLRDLNLGAGPLDRASRLEGMLVSGPFGRVQADYPPGVTGRALTRERLDQWLLECAIAAGATFEEGWTVRGPVVEGAGAAERVRGVQATRRGTAAAVPIPATVTVAADGGRSTIGRSLGLVRHARRPRRWAYGSYVEGLRGAGPVGEMHIRAGYYLGVAPLGGGVWNVCVVAGGRAGRTPREVMRDAVARDRWLIARFEGVEFIGPVRVLGPLAVEARAAGAPGVLLAGDAAGFIDPMTGDGMRLAIRGAMLAADETRRVLELGTFEEAASRLQAARRRELGRKLAFNRLLRGLSGSPAATRAASRGAVVLPSLVRLAVRYAGDLA